MSAEVSERPVEAVAAIAEPNSPRSDSPAPDVAASEPNGVSDKKSESPEKTDEPTANGDHHDRESADEETGTKSSKASSDDEKNDKSAASTPRRRKSGGRASLSGSRAKKNGRRKSVVDVHVNVEPGQYWYARMKGHPPWPAVICDEEMLPSTLLERRPVSARRIDGTWRDDFQDLGKNVKDRRYPVMFLGTNEFAWQPNTELAPLDMDDLKQIVEQNKPGKRAKNLWEAFQVAAEEHDLAYFKEMLHEHQAAVVHDREVRDANQRAKEEKEAAQAAREAKRAKSAAGDDAMYDIEEAPAKPARASRKRKAEDGLNERPVKNAKPKLSLAKASSKPRPRTTPLSPLKWDQTGRLYRTRLQKTFLSNDKAPLESQMPDMNDIFTNLENLSDAMPMEIINAHRLKTVLKAISKKADIPLDDKYNFRERCLKIREKWNTRSIEEGESTVATPNTATPLTATTQVSDKSNGVKKRAAKKAQSENGDSDGDAVMSGAAGSKVDAMEDVESGDAEKDDGKEDEKEEVAEDEKDEEEADAEEDAEKEDEKEDEDVDVEAGTEEAEVEPEVDAEEDEAGDDDKADHKSNDGDEMDEDKEEEDKEDDEDDASDDGKDKADKDDLEAEPMDEDDDQE